MARNRLSKFVQFSAAALPVAYAYRAPVGVDFDQIQLQFGLIYDSVATLNAIVGARVWVIDGKGPGVDDGQVLNWSIVANAPNYTVPCNQQLDIPFSARFSIVVQFYIVGYYALAGNANIEFTINSN